MVYRQDPRDRDGPLDRYLEPGERVQRLATPRRGIVFRKSDALLVPFSLVWGGFAMLWEVVAIASDAPIVFPLFGLPFVAVGAYLIAGRFVHDAWRRKRTLVGLTDRRLLILAGGELTSIPLEAISQLTLKERSDGGGTITLGEPPPVSFRVPLGRQPTKVLELESDARDLHDAILRARDDRLREKASEAAATAAAAAPAPVRVAVDTTTPADEVVEEALADGSEPTRSAEEG